MTVAIINLRGEIISKRLEACQTLETQKILPHALPSSLSLNIEGPCVECFILWVVLLEGGRPVRWGLVRGLYVTVVCS